MSILGSLKNLATRIANKFRGRSEDLDRNAKATQRELRKTLQEGGKESFLSKIKQNIINLFKFGGRRRPSKDAKSASAPLGLDLGTLLLIINKEAFEIVKRNMGDGSRKDILNYRTGRFARSVRGTSITMEGDTTTLYYTFMRYPYDTFMPGGAQEVPRTRRPDRLIERSIRQIATEHAVTKFRAVLSEER